MKKLFPLSLALLCAASLAAQSPDFAITRNDSATVKPCTSSLPCKAGNNMGTPLRIDSANWWKNIFQGDPNSFGGTNRENRNVNDASD